MLSNIGKKEHHLDTHPSQEDFFYLVYLLFRVCSGLFLILFLGGFFLVFFGLFDFCWGFFECVEDILVALFVIIIFSSGLSYKDSLLLL